MRCGLQRKLPERSLVAKDGTTARLPTSRNWSQAISLSVIVPTRNRSAVIARAVGSVLASPCPDLEVVVVDDGSWDNTAEVIAKCTDPRLRYHKIDSDGNANRARNLGARIARGALIAFLDSDDLFLAGRVGRLKRYFASHAETDCLVTSYVEISRGKKRLHKTPSSVPNAGDLRRQLLAHAFPLTNSAIAVRREAFEAVGGFDEAMPRHQDREFLLRLAKSHAIRFSDQADVEKHRSSRSISHAYDGYIVGLDALAARCPDFFLPENIDILRYLVVRSLIKGTFGGRWSSVAREFRQWRQAQALPKDYFACFRAYRRGRMARRKIEATSVDHQI